MESGKRLKGSGKILDQRPGSMCSFLSFLFSVDFATRSGKNMQTINKGIRKQWAERHGIPRFTAQLSLAKRIRQSVGRGYGDDFAHLVERFDPLTPGML
jgi:hypothetical protein